MFPLAQPARLHHTPLQQAAERISEMLIDQFCQDKSIELSISFPISLIRK